MRNWCLWTFVMAALVGRAFGACPNKCSGHGTCGMNDICTCFENWVGGDCGGRQCSYSRAWHDTPLFASDAHYYAECSNRGQCDREKGICECDAGFTGKGCRRMACPDDCSGHGTCEFIEELAKNTDDKRLGAMPNGVAYTAWDQEKIMGCRCDPWFQGHNCAKRSCPKGDDPLTTGQFDMRQAIFLDTESIKVYFTYYDPYGNAYTTSTVSIGTHATQDATCTAIQVALRRLPNNVLNDVVVVGSTSELAFNRYAPVRTSDMGDIGGTAITSAGTQTLCVVRFPAGSGTSGYQNLLQCNVLPHQDNQGMQPQSTGHATAVCTTAEVYGGSGTVAAGNTGVSLPLTELTECSNRGTCDYSTGMCKCYPGHMGLACERQEAIV